MARTNTLPNFLTDVADAIREKKGTEETIQASDFDTEIASIPSGGGSIPTKGFTLDEFDEDGYPTKVKFYGITTLPTNAFSLSGNYWAEMMTRIKTFDFNNVVTEIGEAGITSNSNLIEIKNWGNLTKINKNGIINCNKFNPKTLPDSLVRLENLAFTGDTGMTQLSMNNVSLINGTSNNMGAFYNCTNLKAVWLGSAIYYIYRYSFVGCRNLQKMYINLPRSEITVKGGYRYAFMDDTSKVGIIVCNDDEDFITKEEFDAIDWVAE